MKSCFASWQLGIFMGLGLLVLDRFNPLLLIMAGINLGLGIQLFLSHYCDWYIEKLEEKRGRK